MKTWKRNAIVAAVLVLVCGGIWLNWRYEEAHATELVSTLDREKVLNEAALVLAPTEEGLEALANEPAGGEETAAETFARMRLSRQQSRDSAVRLLQETISYAGEDEDISASSLELDGIVNAQRHLREVQGNRRERLPQKVPSRYRISLHVDDEAVIASWGREYGFHTYLLNAQDDDWKEKIIAYAERIRRMEHPETDETKDNL